MDRDRVVSAGNGVRPVGDTAGEGIGVEESTEEEFSEPGFDPGDTAFATTNGTSAQRRGSSMRTEADDLRGELRDKVHRVGGGSPGRTVSYAGWLLVRIRPVAAMSAFRINLSR